MVRYYDPLRDMNRLMDAAFRQAPTSPSMPLDLYRKGENYYAQIDLPGVNPETIDIDVEDRTLTVRAERAGVEGEDMEWLTHERPVGTFARQLTLGYGVALDKIEADYADGVLTLTFPVAEELKPRKIQVRHKDDGKTIEAENN
ncbi:MAG TPA: Hsp20/alpha crystallin family protein [Actinomyces sp.]|nr:Hsp20/alpha crystallin family protein [Acidobacteriota bacterium]HHT41143.1 Hsp20/alpha crystallin family protein [Actinomyces sp.]